jgi:acyl-CoA thioesterase-2
MHLRPCPSPARILTNDEFSTLLDTSLAAHGRTLYETDIVGASLDHALWFHRPFRADEWLLYAQTAPVQAGGRAFVRGSVFTRAGALVASVAQEGLSRFRQGE